MAKASLWENSQQNRVLAAARAAFRLSPPAPQRLILWAPVALGAGAAAYLALPGEPAPVWVLISFGSALVTALVGLFFRAKPAGLYAGCLVALAALGFGLTQQRALSLIQPTLEESTRAVMVEGWIERVERSQDRERLLIRVWTIDGQTDVPMRVRIRAALAGFRPGDAVSIRAVLASPAGPVAAGGYNAARAAWFDRLGATGFAVAAPVRLADATQRDRWARHFSTWRWQLAERIRQKAGPRTGGLAAALLTGDRSGVSAADSEALRLSGLGHILAISGLHMGLLAGTIYFAFRWVFAAVEPFARAHDPRKPAALIALLAAAAYLVLSGAAVSTQRAFVMAAVVLVGVILDRRAFSLRSLAIAALVVLLLAPESVIEPGFQMSFAAVAALIAVYEGWQRLRSADPVRRGLVRRVGNALAGLSTTSLVAGFATGMFAAFHFQRLAAYGLPANIIAMPVFTFWAMPAGIAALALTPLGLEWPALQIMDAGLRLVLRVAHSVAGFDGAGAGVRAAPGLTIALYGLGFALLTLGRASTRTVGLAVCLCGLLVWGAQRPPDLMITQGGVALARYADVGAEPGWASSDPRRSRFETRVFLQRIAQTQAGRAPLRCDTLGCTATTQEGVRLAFAQTGEALLEDCTRVDLVVFDGLVSAWQRRRCQVPILDDRERERLGGSEFWLRDGEIVRVRSAHSTTGRRLWTPGEAEASLR